VVSGHEERAWHVAWNPTKPLLASCSADKSVRLYNYTKSADGSEINFAHVTTISTGHTKTIRTLAWAPSGETLATASFDSNIGIWEQDTEGEWDCASLLEGHETECKSVAYSNTGTLLASCSRDKTVWIWEGTSTPSFYPRYTLKFPSSP
jgi:WD40 repeat protein